MGDKQVYEDRKEQFQRKAVADAHGEQICGIEFVAYPDGHVSMWSHINHKEEYSEVRTALLAIQTHLDGFIRDGYMCPFNPAFGKDKAEETG